MRHQKRSMWRDLNTRRGRILVTVITLAVLLFLTACSEPARMETEARPPSVAAPGGITVTPLPMQIESSAEDATARPSSLPENPNDAGVIYDKNTGDRGGPGNRRCLQPSIRASQRGHVGACVSGRPFRHRRHLLNRSHGEMRRQWETSDEDGSFSRYR